MEIEYYPQETQYTCGPSCFRMILSALGIKRTEKQLAKMMKTNKVRGTWRKHFSDLAKKYNLSYVEKIDGTLSEIINLQKKGYKVIVCYYYPYETDSYKKFDHYAVVKKIHLNEIHFLDPWFGAHHKYHISYFKKIWMMNPRFSKDKKWFFAVKK